MLSAPHRLVYSLRCMSSNHHRCLSSFVRRSNGRSKPVKDTSNVPFLKSTLNKLFLRIHPDTMQRHPKEAGVNEVSFQKLMEFMTLIKDGGIPPKQRLSLDFYLRTPEEGVFQTATLRLETSGGICYNQVGGHLSAFFTEVGLPSAFNWGTDYWSLSDSSIERKDREWSEEEKVEIKRREQRQSFKEKNFFSSVEMMELLRENEKQSVLEAERVIRKEKEQQVCSRVDDGYLWGVEGGLDFSGDWGRNFLGEGGDEALQDLDLLAKEVAYVPFAKKEDATLVKDILETVIPSLEEKGFRIRGAVMKVWSGERDMHTISGAYDSYTKALISRILMHTKTFEVTNDFNLPRGGETEAIM